MSRYTQPLERRLADQTAEEVRLNHARCLRELQARVDYDIVQDVSLADGVATPISHRLGRVPRMVTVSVVRGATATGRVVEVRDGIDRKRNITLTATDHGATIVVDVKVE